MRRRRSGGEHEDFAFVDCAGERRRIAAVESNAESRGAAALFAGRETVDLDVESDRSDANLDVRFRLRKAAALDGKPHQVTNISTGADGAIWSPDGKNIVFVSAVYPDCKDDACNKQRDEELEEEQSESENLFTICSIGIGTRSPNSSAAICL